MQFDNYSNKVIEYCHQDVHGHRKAIHAGLIRLRKLIREKSDMINYGFGICFNLRHSGVLNDDFSYLAYNAVCYYSRNWPKHSGNVLFPIQNDSHYYHCWKNPLRLELLDYLIRATR